MWSLIQQLPVLRNPCHTEPSGPADDPETTNSDADETCMVVPNSVQYITAAGDLR